MLQERVHAVCFLRLGGGSSEAGAREVELVCARVRDFFLVGVAVSSFDDFFNQMVSETNYETCG